MLNLSLFTPPAPAKIYESLKYHEVMKTTNFHIVKSPFNMILTSIPSLIQLFINFLFFCLMGFYFLEKDKLDPKTQIKSEKKDEISLMNIIKERSKTVGLFVKTNTPMVVKLSYILEYAALTFGMNTLFFHEVYLGSLSDYILLSLPCTIYQSLFNKMIQFVVEYFATAFEAERVSEGFVKEKQKIVLFYMISSVITTFSWYSCAIFGGMLPERIIGWLVDSIQRCIYSLVLPFVFAFIEYVIRIQIRKYYSSKTKDIKKE